jgi:riboflavin kinase/FMN adenylyltransferase
LLMPLERRLKCLADTNLDGCLMLTFNSVLAACSPEAFVDMICAGSGHIANVHCGANWRFGRQAVGTPELLAELGRSRGMGVTIVPAAYYEDQPISSTRIRHAIQEGKLKLANAMLGRPYAIRQTVVHGRGIGRQLGMATANFIPTAEVLPPAGVYVVRTWVGERPISGVANLGWRPTFTDVPPPRDPILEVHLLDFTGDLYGASLEIAFISRLRDELQFPSVAALTEQVRQDIVTAREIIAALPVK